MEMAAHPVSTLVNNPRFDDLFTGKAAHFDAERQSNSSRRLRNQGKVFIGRMNIKETIATINQMQADGVIERYAIGGAVGATFYLEPSATLDVDIFNYLKARLLQFIEAGALDTARFQAIVARHGLAGAWHRFEKQFLRDEP
jgi:hypothetical protein